MDIPGNEVIEDFSGEFNVFMNPSLANRIILGLALTGMILVTHIWVQAGHDFANGCWGFGEATAAASACDSPEFQKMARFVGIPLPLLGYAFYLGVSFLSLLEGAPRRPWRDTARNALLQGGGLVSAYLVAVQAFVLHKFCPLCIASAVITFLLCVFNWTRRQDTSGEPDSSRVGATALAALGIGMGLILFLPRGKVSESEIKFALASQSVHAPSALLTSEWLGSSAATLGTGSISVVAFLDPNCPHCVTTYSKLTELARANRITLHLQSIALWEKSLIQIRFLEVAKKHAKYFEMWDVQFARMKPSGITGTELAEIAGRLGVAGESLDRQLIDSTQVVTDVQRRIRALGIRSSPTVYVAGRLLVGEEQRGRALEEAVDAASTAAKR